MKLNFPMKINIIATTLFTLSSAFAEDSPTAFGSGVDANDTASTGSDRFIIRYKNAKGKSKATANAQRLHLELVPQNAVAVTMNSNAAEQLGRDPDIEYVEVDQKRFPIHLRGAEDEVHDPRRLAESTPYGITMVQADQLTYAGNRKICIIDSGYFVGHEDLPTSGVTGTSNPLTWSSDGCGHGTHVAGTIAAIHNDVGVVGVAPGVDLHMIRVFRDDCYWSYASTLADAANRCVNANANIISMSLGGGSKSRTEESAFKSALNSGVLSIAAAGNGGCCTYSYPASYPVVMSVAAVSSSGTVASFSQKNDQVEIAAPGVDVLSTLPPNNYASWSGTSMATPHVSGVASLVWSNHPSCTATQIRDALICNTDRSTGALGTRTNDYGYGIVKAKKASDALDAGCDQACGTTSGGTCSASNCSLCTSKGECTASSCTWFKGSCK